VVLYHEFYRDHCPSRAASLAYATLLSLVPLMMIGFFILSWFPEFKGIAPAFQKFILSNFVADSASVIYQYLEDFIGHIRNLSLVNIIFLGFMCVLMICNIVGAFNEIWHVRRKRHFATAFGLYFLILFFSPLLFAFLLVLFMRFASLPIMVSLMGITVIKKPFFLLMPYLSEFVIFTLLNWLLPSTKVPFLNAVIVGGITTVLFEFAKYSFTLYLHYVPTYRLIYGALATIPIFLIWIYVSWLIILIGALICRLLSKSIP